MLSFIGVVVVPAVSVKTNVPAVLDVGVVDSLMFSVELWFVLVCINAPACPA
jgi:hypothetical protein